MLYSGLQKSGHEVLLLKPLPLLGRLIQSPTGLGKWLGYIDRFFLFRPRLRRAVDWADIIHICDQANSIYVPWLGNKPNILTCHDMLAIRCALGEIAENRAGFTGRIYQRWILSGMRKAMHIACVSETTRTDVLRITGVSPEKVTVVCNGLNYPFRSMEPRQVARNLGELGLDLKNPFFIHVGNNNWYKNRIGLIKIFAHLVEQNHNKCLDLVVAGAALPSYLCDLAKELGVEDRIKEVGNITNHQLCALYSAAQGLIFPSLAEGFGWPIIEAQACGCPVYTSNRRPMTEVGGNGAVYFDPENDTAAAEIITKERKNSTFWIKSGLRNAINYTAENMIKGYEQIYRLFARRSVVQ